MDYLASVTDLNVFGCVIDFLQTTTQTYLEDPIWDKLQQGKEYTIVFRNCSVTLPEQEQLGGYSIDVRIYSTEERRLHTTCLETAKKAMESFGLFE